MPYLNTEFSLEIENQYASEMHSIFCSVQDELNTIIEERKKPFEVDLKSLYIVKLKNIGKLIVFQNSGL